VIAAHVGTSLFRIVHAMTTRRSDGYTWAITVSGGQPSSSRHLAGIVVEMLSFAGRPEA